MVYRGLWEIQSALKDQADFDIEPFLHDRLNFYQVRGFFLKFFSEILEICSTLDKDYMPSARLHSYTILKFFDLTLPFRRNFI